MERKTSAVGATILFPVLFLGITSLGLAGTLSSLKFEVGPFELLPELILEETYSDNIYHAEVDEEDAVRTRFVFGADAELKLARHSFALGYHGRWNDVTDHDEFDRLDHNFNARFTFKFRSGLIGSVGHVLVARSVEPNFPGDRRNDYLQHVSAAGFRYPVSEKITVAADYAYHEKDYDEAQDKIDDFSKHQLTGRFMFHVTPKTAVFAEYVYFNVDNAYSPTDNKKHDFVAGLKLSFTEKLTGILQSGYTTILFANGKEPSDVTVFADLIYQLRSRTQLKLGFQRDLQETSLADENSVNGDYFIYTGGSVELVQALGDRMRLNVTGSYSRSRFPEEFQVVLRSDNFYLVDARLTYAIQPWLQVIGGGSRSSNESNIEINDFINNQAFVHLRFAAGQ